MKKTIFSVLLVAVLATPAFPQMMMDKPMKGGNMPMYQHQHAGEMGMNMDRMTDMIGTCLENAGMFGLSDEQTKKLTPIHRDMTKKQTRFRAEVKIAEIDLMEIMEVKDFDIEKAGTMVKKIADMKVNHHLEMLKGMKEVRATLTEEQFNKMRQTGMGKIRDKKPAAKKPAQKMMKK